MLELITANSKNIKTYCLIIHVDPIRWSFFWLARKHPFGMFALGMHSNEESRHTERKRDRRTVWSAETIYKLRWNWFSSSISSVSSVTMRNRRIDNWISMAHRSLPHRNKSTKHFPFSFCCVSARAREIAMHFVLHKINVSKSNVFVSNDVFQSEIKFSWHCIGEHRARSQNEWKRCWRWPWNDEAMMPAQNGMGLSNGKSKYWKCILDNLINFLEHNFLLFIMRYNSSGNGMLSGFKLWFSWRLQFRMRNLWFFKMPQTA